MGIFPGLAGNDGLKKRMDAAFVSGSSPAHALIAEGPDGSGRHTFALQYAAALSCEKRREYDGNSPLPCGKCRNCRKILSGISPDVITVGNDDKASLGVDKIRDLRQDVHIFPNDLEHKVYIIEQADTMTVQAQNAFLLTLEEPPAYAVFILLCRNSGALLETVRSRAPVIRMQPLTRAQTEQVISGIMPEAGKIKASDPDKYAAALASAAGSAGRAVELLRSAEGDEAAQLYTGVGTFISLCHDKRMGAQAMTELVRDCENSREKSADFLKAVIAACRDLIALQKNSECEPVFFTDTAKAAGLSECFSAKKLLLICSAAEKAATAVSRGMNVRLTLMTMLSESGII